MNVTSYRKWAYLATILTGFSALCAQVVWQRYLAILVGGEARSLTLVVAVFLSGLALGYYVFGFITEKKKWPRHLLLKLYGYIELLTAVYIIIFFAYFELLKVLSFNSPAYFIIDVLISFLALLLPTFLMGASIPLLTATLPDDSQEVNTVHAKIYGWNTLGACFGCLVSGFYLVPVFGLDISLVIVGIINLLASLVFILNPLKGNVHKQDEFPIIPSVLSNRFYILFTFLTGAVIISFEVFFVRILHLSIYGARVYNFPLILSIFVGGLAIGSLSVGKKDISVKHLLNQLLSTILLMGLLFWITPYWSLWISNIRKFIGFGFLDYVFFQCILFLFIFVFLFPAVFCMGQLLPLAYTLMKKNVKNYGRICGALYFFNTLGTVVGAIGIGYLALYILNIDSLLKINIYILSLLALIIAFFEKKRRYTIALIIFTVIFAFIPLGWNKKENYPNYVLNGSNISDKKWFSFPKIVSKNRKRIYFNDGPNTTVIVNQFSMTKKSVLKAFKHPALPPFFSKGVYYNIVTNGKTDSNTLGDFSTLFLIPGLPWLFAPSNVDGLSTAVVGLGTGVSAGLLGKFKGVKGVDVLEISPKVIESIKKAPPYLNFNVFDNPKINFIETDAFKYFTKSRKKFDVIVSEPSNVWVAGVENLFSLEFYELASRSLSEGGILGQWIQGYGIDVQTMTMILRTIKKVFPYTELYKIGFADVLIIASQKPLNHNFSDKKFFDSFFHKFLKSFGIQKKEDIYLIQVLDSHQYEQLISVTSRESKEIHSLTKPKLSYRADKTLVIAHNFNPYKVVPLFMGEKDQRKLKRAEVFQNYKNTSPEFWEKKCPRLSGFSFLCAYMEKAVKEYQSFTSIKKDYFSKLERYSFLRQRGLIKHKEKFLNEFFSKLIKKKLVHKDVILTYINERMRKGSYEVVYQHIAMFKEKKLIDEKKYQSLKDHIDSIKKRRP